MRAFIVFLLITTTFCMGQAPDSLKKIELTTDYYIGTDAYTNNYFVHEMAFYKQGPDGDFVFKDFSLGPLTKVDIINPLKIMLFYEQTNTVIFVDNRLNEIERINFNTLAGFVNISNAGNAGNNRLWLFNTDSQQLELYDYRQQRALQTSLPMAGKPIDMASNFNYCYLLFEDALVTYNVYGSFMSEIPIENASQVAQHDENVWVVKENELLMYPEPGLDSAKKPSDVKKVPLPEITIKQLHLTQDFLYIYNGVTLHQFTNNQPKK